MFKGSKFDDDDDWGSFREMVDLAGVARHKKLLFHERLPADPVKQEILNDHYIEYLVKISEDERLPEDQRQPICLFIQAMEVRITEIVDAGQCISRKDCRAIKMAIKQVGQQYLQLHTSFRDAYAGIKGEYAAIVSEVSGVIISAAIEEEKVDFVAVIWRGTPQRIQLLLEQGLNPNRLLDGKTALMYAAQSGRADVLAVLLANLVVKPSLEIRSEFERWTALMFAVSYREAAATKVLLDAGADILARGRENPSVIDDLVLELLPSKITVFEMAAADNTASRERVGEGFEQKHQETMEVIRRKYAELLLLSPNTLSADIFDNVFSGDRVALCGYLCAAIRNKMSLINNSDMLDQQKMENKGVLIDKLWDVVNGRTALFSKMLFREQGFLVELVGFFSKKHKDSIVKSNKDIKVAIEDLIEELQLSLRTSTKLAMPGPASG